MDTKQLATMQHSISQGSSANPLLIQTGQPQSRTNILNEMNGSHISIIPSSVGQPAPSQDNVCRPSFSSQNDFSDEVDAEVKRSRGFVPNYDVFNDLNWNRTQDWHLQNVESSPQHSNQQRFSSIQKRGRNRVPSANNTTNFGQHFNSSVSDIPTCTKAERLPDMGFQNSLFTERFGQEDLISVILKQVLFLYYHATCLIVLVVSLAE